MGGFNLKAYIAYSKRYELSDWKVLGVFTNLELLQNCIKVLNENNFSYEYKYEETSYYN